MKYFEDLRVGEREIFGSHTFTAAEIKAFATRFDPQAFHLDEGAARQSHFGALCASGWHTVAIWMRLRIEALRREDDERRRRGERIAQLGPSPGFRELKWLRPVFAGDTITFASEVIETRQLNSRPGWGLFAARNTGTNQHGDLVFSFIGTGFLQRRG